MNIMRIAVSAMFDISIAQSLIRKENHVIVNVYVKTMIPFINFIVKLKQHRARYVSSHLKSNVLHGIISAENMKLYVIAPYVLLHSGNLPNINATNVVSILVTNFYAIHVYLRVRRDFFFVERFDLRR
jgi:hypothetical protein